MLRGIVKVSTQTWEDNANHFYFALNGGQMRAIATVISRNEIHKPPWNHDDFLRSFSRKHFNHFGVG